jgi:hypothetical protein
MGQIGQCAIIKAFAITNPVPAPVKGSQRHDEGSGGDFGCASQWF